MGVPRARRTKSKQGQRRSHLALKKKVLTVCSHCQASILPHTVCVGCGYYKGKQVVGVATGTGKKKTKVKS